MKLSKTDAQYLIDTHTSWICSYCLEEALPINACTQTENMPTHGPKFKIKCSSCPGWCYSPLNLRTCNWCNSYVHTKCLKYELGCKTCCESLIPGFNTEPYQLLDDGNRLSDLLFNPYHRDNQVNEIGSLIDDEYNMEYWNEISNILVGCNYTQQKHVNNAKPSELKIFTLNVRSLIKTIDHFREELDTYCKYDVLCFNETNLTENKLPNGISDILLEGFHEPTLRDPERTSGRGGGLAMYINKRVCDSENIEQILPNLKIERNIKSSGEFMLVKIHNCKGYNKTKIIANTYRSPSRDPQNFITLIDSLLFSLERHCRKHVVFTGDFNLDLINLGSNTHCQNLLDTMSKYGFFQLVARPTRITSHSATLIDHVYSNNVHHTLSCNVLTTDISDHLATLTTISIGDFCFNDHNSRSKTPRTPKNFETRTFNAANNLIFKELIEAETWQHITPNVDANEHYNLFYQTYKKHYDAAYPTESRGSKRKNERRDPKPFILPWLEDACARKNELYYRSVTNISEKNTVAYRKMKKFCSKHIDAVKDKYYKKYFEEYQFNSKKQWQMINKLLGRKTNQCTKIKLKKVDGTMINSDTDVADHFNTYFSNIATKIKEQISARTTFDPGGHKIYMNDPVAHSMFISPTDPAEIQRIICSLKNKTTQDVKIEPLKIANECLSFRQILSTIINSSFSQGIFPSSLKTAKVVPIHKGGSKSEVTNYRPISLLCTFSKIYEKLMHSRVLGFLERNCSLFEGQYGFRPGRSCEHALLDAKSTILHSLSKKEVVLLLLIDFSKAFDVISHDILLDKLNYYGIRGLALKWFKSYLCSRKQFVSIEDSQSTVQEIKHGVPQGSILGPLLFIIYINDMPKISTHLKFVLYADDANILITGQNVEEVVQKVNKLSPLLLNWVDNNGLALNLKKTCYMLFTSTRNRSPNIDIQLAGTNIERKTDARFLGVIVDDKLTWSSHIAAIKTKMMRYVGIMYKIKRHLPIKVMLQIFQSFVQSHLNYCSLIWGFAAKSHIDSLFCKQKQGIRAVMPGFVNYFYKSESESLPQHTKKFFDEHKILTVQGLVVQNSIVLLHKIKYLSRLLPKNICHTFPDVVDLPKANSDHITANTWLQKYGSRYFKNTVFFKGPLLSIFADNMNVTTPTSLLSVNIIKKNAKNMLLDLQKSHESADWQPFLLNNIPGLRRSNRYCVQAVQNP